jgi:hypothetical protein
MGTLSSAPNISAGLACQRSSLCWQHRPAEDCIDLDLDLARVVLDNKLRVAKLLGPHLPCIQAELCDAAGDGIEFACDCWQRLVASVLPRRVDHVDVDGQPRHVANEEVDRRAALHREDVVGKHVRRDRQQQAHGVGVALIHGT